MSGADAAIASVLRFWNEAGEDLWFAKDEAFDRRFRERFLDLHLAVAARRHDDWIGTVEGALALIILADQFPRNAWRGTAHMYATDPLARLYGRQAAQAGFMAQVADALKVFFVLPFAHSENAADQDLCVALSAVLDAEAREHAEMHRDIIRRFGRFPHRNAMLARETTPEEAAFLANGGFSG
ncbi:DUF924 family protein [Ancylobacter sp. VNQ12]|uniref:DUF924 family protein n=1 Tax=Ancylobacter sp. VNQ12 TaxID=3400920 RepID=UPI003C0A8E23